MRTTPDPRAAADKRSRLRKRRLAPPYLLMAFAATDRLRADLAAAEQAGEIRRTQDADGSGRLYLIGFGYQRPLTGRTGNSAPHGSVSRAHTTAPAKERDQTLSDAQFTGDGHSSRRDVPH